MHRRLHGTPYGCGHNLPGLSTSVCVCGCVCARCSRTHLAGEQGVQVLDDTDRRWIRGVVVFQVVGGGLHARQGWVHGRNGERHASQSVRKRAGLATWQAAGGGSSTALKAGREMMSSMPVIPLKSEGLGRRQGRQQAAAAATAAPGRRDERRQRAHPPLQRRPRPGRPGGVQPSSLVSLG